MMAEAADGGIVATAEALSRQMEAILLAWGMPADQATTTARIMLEADLRGVDSHGVSMFYLYEQYRATDKLTMAPEIRVVRESPVTALVDGGGGLGHAPSELAMRLAIEKCAKTGLAAVAVRNSNHYGAAGVYALMAAEAGFIGLSTTNVWNTSIVPTRSTEALFGTNPIAFAAPAGRNKPFCLDMATSTVALGKLKLAQLNDRPLKPGWAFDAAGAPTLDPDAALAARKITPLGGSPELSSHKGYGLAAMVEILSGTLPGAFWAANREETHPGAERYNVGHFFLAMDPTAFRDDEGGFEADLDAMIDRLRAADRLNPSEPVLVAGDPEDAAYARRLEEGVPMPAKLVAMIRRIASECGAEYCLEDR